MSTPRHERFVELLTDRALVGLEPKEQIELAELMLEFPDEDATAYDRAAAAIDLATLQIEAMPASLLDKIQFEASSQAKTEYFEPPQASRPLAGTLAMPDAPPRPSNVVVLPTRAAPTPAFAPPPAGPSRAFAIGGWIAAAACLALAIGAFAYRTKPADPVSVLPPASTTAPIPTPTLTAPPPPTPREETASALRERLLALKTTAKMEWTATKDPAAKGASGDVVWNAEEQKGTMRFRGLAKNDASKSQYQLWIFDKGREEKFPVDGGVFDVDAETGDVVVAIKARLPVDKAALFAVTVERPGGVVVSKRERIVLTAKPTT